MLLFGVTLAKMKNGNLSFLAVIFNSNCLVDRIYSIIPLFLFMVAGVGGHCWDADYRNNNGAAKDLSQIGSWMQKTKKQMNKRDDT